MEQKSRTLVINLVTKSEGTLSRLVLSKEEILKMTVGNTSTWKPTVKLKQFEVVDN